MSENDRASRLRDRRRRAKEKAESSETDETSKSSEPSKRSETSEAAETDKTGEPSKSRSVKEEQIGTYMYLPEPQHDELRYRYNILKAEYEQEFDSEFEKNRHFFPLVIQHGLDGLDGLDAQDIRDRLDSL